MMTVIMGGSGSGKSAYAEDYLLQLSADMERYYLATMQVYGNEGKRKVERHRELRKGKGFHTIEQTHSIGLALEQIKDPGSAAVLLECMSNLSANEMFSESGIRPVSAVVEAITSDIALLRQHVKHLVIVTNNIFEDGIQYDESTMEYLRALGQINQKISHMADKVIEIVVGIPVVLKEG